MTDLDEKEAAWVRQLAATPAPGLTEAWAAVEAALPEQGRIAVQGREEGQYEAWAQARQESGFRGLGFGYGPTPAAALTNLAAALRSHTDG